MRNGKLAWASGTALGGALVVLYVFVVATALPLGHDIRPLFDQVGPPPTYRWVHAPPQFAATNVRPRPSETDVPLGPDGSEQSGAQSEDRQVVLNLAARAAPPHPPDRSLRVRIVPLDPSTLGPTPPRTRPDGNAYHVVLTYQPSGQAVTTLAQPGNVLLSVPELSVGLLYSADGRSWQQVASQAVAAQGVVGGRFAEAGYYLGITRRTPGTSTFDGGRGGGVSGTLLVTVLVAVLALALGLFPVVRRRLRRRG